MFNEQVDQFEPMFQVDHVYYISKASIKAGNPRFTKSEFEMSLNKNSTVEEVFDADDIPQKRYDFLESVDSVQDMEVNRLVDVIGVISSCPDYSTIISKRDNKELQKRSIQVVDTMGRPLELTLWGEQAINFEGVVGQVIAIKNGRVGEFQGQKNLTAASTSQIDLDPPLEMKDQLSQWYQENSQSLPSQPQRAGRGGGFDASQYSISTLEDLNELVRSNAQDGNKKPVLCKIKGTCNWIKHDERAPLFYKASPKGNKVIENTTTNNGKQWYCQKTGEYFDSYEPRLCLTLIMSDHTSGEYVQAFDDCSRVLLADEKGEPMEGRTIEAWKENGEEASLNFAFDRPIDTRRWVYIKGMEGTWQEENRIKLTVMHLEEIDHQAESKRLLEEIGRML